MTRVILYVLTNLAVMFVFGIILSLFGIDASNTSGLLVMALLFGFGGSLISLLMSKNIALRAVGGKVIIQPETEQEYWLLNTVQQQAQQVGINMPDVAIYNAPDMNAFATGARRNHALVSVSSALLNTMTQDEAEAVIAHEISHIANGDMITMTLLQGILNTFVIFISRLLAKIVATTMANTSNNNGQMSHAIYFMITMVFELVFGMFASIIVMWFSRQREFYADAGSAALVGKEKMIAALEKLKVSRAPQEQRSVIAFCINGETSKQLTTLFLSHPPLDKRIEALRNGQYTQNSTKSTLIS